MKPVRAARVLSGTVVRGHRMLLLLAAVTATAVLMAACGASGANGTAVQTNASNVTAPARGELPSVTWWVWYRPLLTLDPIKFKDYPEDEIINNLCEPLSRVTPDGKVDPGLATVSNPDALTWVYKLRSGVTFWDGSKVTADDVVFSLKRNLDPKWGSFYGDMLANVASIQATAPDQVTIKLSQPQATFNERMACPVGMVISKSFAERAGDKFGSPGTGIMATGPFKVESWNGSTSITLVRNDTYWNQATKAKVGKITFVWPQDPGTVANGFLTGAFDGGFNVIYSAMAQLRDTSVGKLYVGSDDQTRMIDGFMFVNTKNSAAADPRLREALYLSIDRAAIAKIVYLGTAEPLYTLTGPGWWGGSANAVYKGAYDAIAAEASDLSKARERAKALVQEAGPIAKEPIVLATTNDEQSQLEVSLIRDGAVKVGLNFQIKTLPAEQYGQLFSDKQYRERIGVNAIGTLNYDHVPDPLLMYEDALTKGSPDNMTDYDNPEVNALVKAAEAETDPVRRADIVVKIQQAFRRDLPWMPIVSPQTVMFMNNRVTGAPISFCYLETAWAAWLGAP